jgi:hypothetical protein
MTLGVSLAVSVFAGAAGFLPFGGLIGAGIRFGWLFAIGVLYLPAALIVAAHDERWLAPLNPAPAVALITRIPGSYFVACAMLLGLFAFSGGAVAAARTLGMPFVGSAIEWVLGSLPLVAAARMLGILVYEKREEL